MRRRKSKTYSCKLLMVYQQLRITGTTLLRSQIHEEYISEEAQRNYGSKHIFQFRKKWINSFEALKVIVGAIILMF